MSYIDNGNPFTEDTDKKVTCEDCEGKGHTGVSACCGADIDEDHLICHDCKEHSEFEECERCDGDGWYNEDEDGNQLEK